MSSNFKTSWTRSETSRWFWVLAFDSRTEQRPVWIFETITSNVSRQLLWLIIFNQKQTRFYFSSFGSGFLPGYGWSILNNHSNKLTKWRFLRRSARRNQTDAVYSGRTQTNTTKQLFSQSFQSKMVGARLLLPEIIRTLCDSKNWTWQNMEKQPADLPCVKIPLNLSNFFASCSETCCIWQPSRNKA